jgi:hypothetical protein
VRGSWRTIVELTKHFIKQQRLIFIPLLIVLLLASLLLLITQGLAYVSPFVYALF